MFHIAHLLTYSEHTHTRIQCIKTHSEKGIFWSVCWFVFFFLKKKILRNNINNSISNKHKNERKKTIKRLSVCYRFVATFSCCLSLTIFFARSKQQQNYIWFTLVSLISFIHSLTLCLPFFCICTLGAFVFFILFTHAISHFVVAIQSKCCTASFITAPFCRSFNPFAIYC